MQSFLKSTKSWTVWAVDSSCSGPASPGKTAQEEVPNKPDVHHIIGKSQNHPENISLFLQKYTGDPAIKVWAQTHDKENQSADISLGLHSKTQRPFTSLHQSYLV